MKQTTFDERMLSLVQILLPENLQAELRTVEKNNGVVLVGITLDLQGDYSASKGNKSCPIVYLDSFHERFNHGEYIEVLAREVTDLLVSSTPDFQVENILSWDFLKDHLLLKLVNAKKNVDRYKEYYMIPYMDLYISFYIELVSETVGVGIIDIKREWIENLNIPRKDLYDIALQNTMNKKQEVFRPLREIIEEDQHLELPPADIMHISNEGNRYGASVILYSSEIKLMAMSLKSNLYLLPSSVHEFLVLPCGKVSLMDLKNIVYYQNHFLQSEEEILSDEIYLYDWKKDLVTIA